MIRIKQKSWKAKYIFDIISKFSKRKKNILGDDMSWINGGKLKT